MKSKRKHSLEMLDLDCDATRDAESDMDDDRSSDKSEEEDLDETAHANLLKDITKIRDKKRLSVTRAVRTSSGAVRSIDKQDVLKRLGDSVLEKQSKKFKTLPKPLEKPVEIRAKKAAGYEKVVTEVNQWEKLVDIHRKADHLTFPLNQPDVRIKTVEATRQLPMKTSLENEVYSLLRGAKLQEPKKEKSFKKYMSLAAVKEKNREMWIMKELQRKAERKAWMQNKSKSRKYHRLLRKERKKKEKAELEELQRTDPEAALEILQELEKTRIAERMSLRHRKSKWAKTHTLRAKHDKTSLAAVQENERVHKELVKKMNKNSVDEDEENKDEDMETMLKEREEAAAKGMCDPMNPWLTAGKKTTKSLGVEGEGGEKEDESFSKFKKFWDEVNNRKVMEKKFLEEQAAKEKEQKKEKGVVEIEVMGLGKQEEEKELEEIKKVSESEDSNDETESDNDDKEEEEEEVLKAEEEDMGEEEVQVRCQTQEEENEKREVEEDGPPHGTKCGKKEGMKEIDSTGEEGMMNEIAVGESKNKTNQEVDIDEIFDEAEYQIQKKVDAKINKMNKKKKKRRRAKETTTLESDKDKLTIIEYDFTSHNTTENTSETLQRVCTMEEVEKLAEKGAEDTIEKPPTILLSGDRDKDEVMNEENVEVDPTKFMQVKAKKLHSAKPEKMADGEALDDDDDDDDEDDDPQDIIREAFADDYLVNEFRSEKEEAVKRDTPADLCLAMPGWGDWTGPNIQMSKKKVKRFTVKVPKPRRKDSKLGHVIYNEKADLHANIRKVMVSDLPREFSSVKDFEASIRAPVGRNFVPELVHRKLTKPPVITKMGAIIEPIEKEMLMQVKKKSLAVIGVGKKVKPQVRNNRGTQKKMKPQKKNNQGTRKKAKPQERNNQGTQKKKGVS